MGGSLAKLNWIHSKSYGKFLHWETYFFKQKTCPICKKMPFNIQCKTFITIRNDKKIVLCFGQDFLVFGPFLGFFGLQKAFGLLQAKKIPKTALRPKNLAAAQNFFCPSSCWYCFGFQRWNIPKKWLRIEYTFLCRNQ